MPMIACGHRLKSNQIMPTIRSSSMNVFFSFRSAPRLRKTKGLLEIIHQYIHRQWKNREKCDFVVLFVFKTESIEVKQQFGKWNRREVKRGEMLPYISIIVAKCRVVIIFSFAKMHTHTHTINHNYVDFSNWISKIAHVL